MKNPPIQDDFAKVRAAVPGDMCYHDVAGRGQAVVNNPGLNSAEGYTPVLRSGTVGWELGGGGPTSGYYEPLVYDGEILFYDGDVLMYWVTGS